LREPRRSAVRDLLAARLGEAGRFDEVVDLLREATQERPEEARAWRRLGAALLFLKGDPANACIALQEAVRLTPDDAPALLLLGLCRSALAEHAEAVAAFEAALRADPEALRSRPAAEAALAAARRGERWPPAVDVH
jgi:tetratricopeptide (TPR) repeat protein